MLLQKFVLDQNPLDLPGLWHDRRDACKFSMLVLLLIGDGRSLIVNRSLLYSLGCGLAGWRRDHSRNNSNNCRGPADNTAIEGLIDEVSIGLSINIIRLTLRHNSVFR